MKYHLYPFDRVYRGRWYTGTINDCLRLARFQYVSWVLMREDGRVMAWTYDTVKHIAGLRARYAQANLDKLAQRYGEAAQ